MRNSDYWMQWFTQLEQIQNNVGEAFLYSFSYVVSRMFQINNIALFIVWKFS